MRGSLTFRCAVALALAAPLGLGLGFVLRDNRLASGSAPEHALTRALSGLHIPQDNLNFGEVWEDREFKWVLPIENRGKETVEITGFVSSCLCSSINPKSLVIPTGEAREVELTLDLTPKQEKSHGQSTREFQLKISPTTKIDTENGIRGKDWIIDGRVKKVLRYSLAAVDFGKHSVRAQPLDAHRVFVSTYAPLTKLQGYCSSTHFQAKLRPAGPRSSEYELEIRPIGILPVGRVQFEVQVTAELQDGHRVAAKEIPILVEVANDIQAGPPQVCFGAKNLGNLCEETLTLSSLTNSRFRVLNVRTEGDDLTVERIIEKDGMINPMFLVRQRISQLGEQERVAVMAVQHGEREFSEVRVPVRFHGIAVNQAE